MRGPGSWWSSLLWVVVLAACPKPGSRPVPVEERDDVSIRIDDKFRPLGDLQRLEPAAAGQGWCNAATADLLLAACPTPEERQQIRADFNISYGQQLADEGVLAPWTCTDRGSESSIMLSTYNMFRLARCIPFSEELPWAPGTDNLYDWLLAQDLTVIQFFWAADADAKSHGWNKSVHIIGNDLSAPRFRHVIESSSGIGLIYSLVLLAHESRHAAANLGHNCGYKDTNLAYQGAWAVQYQLLDLLATKTGDYFTAYERNELASAADEILATRFCDSPP